MNMRISDWPARMSAPRQEQPGPTPGDRREHTVSRGETVGEVARHYQVSSAAIIQANPQAAIDATRPLTEGDVLEIPDGPLLVPHTVQPDETVESIASRTVASADTVRTDNGLAEGEQVLTGDVLWVPQSPFVSLDAPFSLYGQTAVDQQQAECAVIDIARNFDAYDTDANGVVTEAELQYVVDNPDQFGGVDDPRVIAAVTAFLPVEVDPSFSLLIEPRSLSSTSWQSGQRVVDVLLSGEPDSEQHGIPRQGAIMLFVGAQLPDGLDAQAAAAFASDQAVAVVAASNEGWIPPGEATQRFEALIGSTSWTTESVVELVGGLTTAGIRPEQLVAVLDQTTQDMTPTEFDGVLTQIQPQLEQAALARHTNRGDDSRPYERDYEYAAVADFYTGLAGLYGRAGEGGRNAIVQALVPTIPNGDLEAIDDAAVQLLQSPENWEFFAALVSELEFAGKTDAVQALLGVIDDAQLIGPAEASVAEYSELTEQYYFALQMRPLYTDDASFKAAMDLLMTETLGEDWEAQVEQGQAAVVAEGETLLLRLDQFGHDPDIVALIANDPNAQLAISMALAQDPTLVEGEAGVRLLEVFAANGVVGADNPLAAIVVDAYMRANVHQPLADPALTPQARAGLVEQAMGHDVLAQVLGADSEEYTTLVGEMSRLAAGEGVELDVAEGSLDATDLFGQTITHIESLDLPPDMSGLLKFGAVGVTALSVGESIDEFLENPGAGAGFEVLVDAANLGVSGVEVMQSYRGLGGESTLIKPAQRFLFVVGAGMATYEAYERIGDGDWAGAGLNGVIAGGLLHAGLAGGPVGIGVAAVAQVVLLGYDGWRTAQHNNRFENDAQEAFLAASMLDDDTAGVLHDTSGGAVSPVPFLLRYCELNGLTIEQSIDYLNSLSPDQLTLVRQTAHHTLDELSGDPAAFVASNAEDDAAYQQVLEESAISPDWLNDDAPALDPNTDFNPEGNPVTATQFDALMAQIGVPTPTEWLAADV